MENIKDKPVIIAEGKLLASGRKFQYILLNVVKKFVWGKNCLKFLVIVFTCSSCSDLIDQDHYYVAPELKVFVDRFYSEASVRGITIGKENVEVLIGDIKSSNSVEGRSTESNVVIDKKFYESNIGHSWNDKFDSLDVEYVVFHELGHYLLHRDHENKFTIMTPDGTYKGDYQSDSIKRKLLIDELFTLKP